MCGVSMYKKDSVLKAHIFFILKKLQFFLET